MSAPAFRARRHSKPPRQVEGPQRSQSEPGLSAAQSQRRSQTGVRTSETCALTRQQRNRAGTRRPQRMPQLPKMQDTPPHRPARLLADGGGRGTSLPAQAGAAAAGDGVAARDGNYRGSSSRRGSTRGVRLATLPGGSMSPAAESEEAHVADAPPRTPASRRGNLRRVE
jgi:hypothetical protein